MDKNIEMFAQRTSPKIPKDLYWGAMYKLFGLTSASCTTKALNKKFEEIVLRFHPAKVSPKERQCAERMMIFIQFGFEALSDGPSKRCMKGGACSGEE